VLKRPLLVYAQRALGLALEALGLPLNVLGVPFGLALNVVGLPLSLALNVLDLLLVPGSQARHGAGPAFLVYPSQRRQHDGTDGHPLVEAAASQDMTQQSQPDQPQRQPSPGT